MMDVLESEFIFVALMSFRLVSFSHTHIIALLVWFLGVRWRVFNSPVINKIKVSGYLIKFSRGLYLYNHFPMILRSPKTYILLITGVDKGSGTHATVLYDLGQHFFC